MKSLSRFEIVGVSASILAALAIVGAARFLPFVRQDSNAAAASTSEIVISDARKKDREAALAAAVAEATDRSGNVTRLVVHDATTGKGREARIGDTVTIDYAAASKDGPEFDNTYNKGMPFTFKLGAEEVIEGLEKGMIGMHEGGERVLVIPPDMGYGNAIVDPLPANATLIFSIALLSIE